MREHSDNLNMAHKVRSVLSRASAANTVHSITDVKLRTCNGATESGEKGGGRGKARDIVARGRVGSQVRLGSFRDTRVAHERRPHLM